jgi:hypothetical protein
MSIDRWLVLACMLVLNVPVLRTVISVGVLNERDCTLLFVHVTASCRNTALDSDLFICSPCLCRRSVSRPPRTTAVCFGTNYTELQLVAPHHVTFL